jgi:subtilisin family serine protease
VHAASTTATNASFGSQIGLNSVLADGKVSGKGYAVAVIDTGIDYNNPALGGGWGKRVVAGYDFFNNDADPMDDNGHGTHVAGIIGANDPTNSGLAPNVNFVALKVLGADGSGSFGAVQKALDWVVANRTKYNIVAINMSLGSGNYTADPFTFLDGDFQTLTSQGVFISVAAGNSFYSFQSAPGLDFPAVSPNVVSVGAVWDGNYGSVGWASGARDNTTAVDRIVSFSQRSSALSIVAPGAMVTSTYLNNQWRMMAGTSMAAPVVAGAAVLVHQALDATGHSSLANQSSILGIMQSTGVKVVDGDDENDNVTNTGLSFKRLDIAAALKAVANLPGGSQNIAPVVAPIAAQKLTPGGSTTIALSATDANGDAITLTARVLGVDPAAAQLYQLKQSLGLSYAGSYYLNAWGKNEKWLQGSGSTFFAILPNGELRRWTGTLDGMMSASSLIANVGVMVYADPSQLWNAKPAAAPVTVQLTGNQLVVTADPSASGSYTVDVTASDGKASSDTTFTVTVAAAPVNHPPVWGTLSDRTMSPRQGSLTVPLNATDPDGDPLIYTASVVGADNVTLKITGNQLLITPPAGYTGTFTVEVTANDGQASSVASFHVNVVNNPPTLTLQSAVVVPTGTTSVNVNYVASDPDGDPITVTASVESTPSTAYQLKQSLGLTYAGSYFQNMLGLGEKWMVSSDGKNWYAILPNGELRKYASTSSQMLNAANLVATLDPSFYADPSKLWNAASTTTPNATATVVGGVVQVAVQNGYHGTLLVDVVVSDGLLSVKKTVAVTFS